VPLLLTRAAPGDGRVSRLPWHRSPRLPDGDLPDTIDAGEARDALLTHGRADLAIALLLPADAAEACRRGHGLLVAAATLAGTGGGGGRGGGDYRRALGVVPPLAIAAIARAGAWLSACGRAGYAVRTDLSDAAATTPHPPPVADPAQAQADTPSGTTLPRPTPAPPAPTTGEAVTPSPSTPEEGMIVGAAGEGASPHRAVFVADEDDGAEGDPGGPPAPGPGAVYIADPAGYYVSDPDLGGERPTQVPAYFTDWLSDERATGTDGHGGKP